MSLFATTTAVLEAAPEPRPYPKPLTPQYYLSSMAAPSEIEVVVTETDFLSALSELTPSVSPEEMKHYDSVQKAFASETINSDKTTKHKEKERENEKVKPQASLGKKGKGKARAQ